MTTPPKIDGDSLPRIPRNESSKSLPPPQTVDGKVEISSSDDDNETTTVSCFLFSQGSIRTDESNPVVAQIATQLRTFDRYWVERKVSGNRK